MTINLLQPAIEGQKVTSVWQRSSRYIVCLFCELRARQVGDSPLCSNCLIDPAQTRTAIYLQQHAIEKQIDATEQTWLDFASQHADAWDRVRASMDLPDFAERAARHRAAGNIYGKLLDALSTRETALAPLQSSRDRLERALGAIGDV